VLGDPNFGLPYWDWAADGMQPAGQQRLLPIWTANGMGGTGGPVTTGPFVFNPADPQSFRVSIDISPTNALRAINPRGLRRSLGGATLPTTNQTTSVLGLTSYDAAPWDGTSSGFRNRLEGWRPTPPGLHNRVHVFVGGDMGLSTSPNDPVFYLNHCNVDRLWEAWMGRHGRQYEPIPAQAPNLFRHRIDDAMFPLIAPSRTPRQMLDATAVYTYDSLNP
jgi:tyrosinase